MAGAKVKLKDRELRELRDKIAIVNYALEKALHDCFLREEVFDLLNTAQDAGIDIERRLGT